MRGEEEKEKRDNGNGEEKVQTFMVITQQGIPDENIRPNNKGCLTHPLIHTLVLGFWFLQAKFTAKRGSRLRSERRGNIIDIQRSLSVVINCSVSFAFAFVPKKPKCSVASSTS
jgi:hypothetical protein